MSVSLPAIAIFPGAPAGTPLAPGAEGLIAFGSLPDNPDAAPAFGSMLAAATAAPAEPMLASVATQDGSGNLPMLATPGGATAPASPVTQAEMLVPYHWSADEETMPQATPHFASNEGLSVELGMNARADRGGIATTTAEPATAKVSAETASGEPAAMGTIGMDAQPTVSGRKPEVPTTYRPAIAALPDSTGQEGPVAPARPQSRRRNPTVSNALQSTAGSDPAVAFSTSAAMNSAGRMEILAAKAGASAIPASLTSGWRNIAGLAVKSAPVSAPVVESNAAVVAQPVSTVSPSAVAKTPVAETVASAQPVGQVVAVAVTSVADVAPSTGSEQPVLPGVEVSALPGAKPSIGRSQTLPVAVQPTPSALPVAAVAVAPTAEMIAPALLGEKPAVDRGSALPVAVQPTPSALPVVTIAVAPTAEMISPALLDAKTSIGRSPTMPVAVQSKPSALPAATVAVAPTAEIVTPAQPTLPVGQAVVVATTGDITAAKVTVQPVSLQAALPEFPVVLSGVEPGANRPVEPKAPVLVTPTTAPATPIAAMVESTSSPKPAAELVVAVDAPAIVAPATIDQPISAGQGMPPIPMVLPVGSTNPAVPSVALPTLPATPKTGPAASAIAQPKIYEQQILAEPKKPISPIATPLFVQPESEPLAVPVAVTLETPSDVVDIASYALLTAVVPAKSENPLPNAQSFRANPTGPTPVRPVTTGNPDLGVPPLVAKLPTIGTIGVAIPNVPTLADSAPATPALLPPIISAVNPVATIPTIAAVLPPPIGEPQILPVPPAALLPIQMPVVAFAPDTATETTPPNSTDAQRQQQHPMADVGACLQAIAPLPSRASSLLQLNDSATGDINPAPLTNLATPAPVLVPALPVPVAAVSVPVLPLMPIVANSVLTAATTVTRGPKVDPQPDLSGQEMPVPAAEPPVAGSIRSTPVTVPLVPAAEPVPGLVPSTVIASEILPATANETKPVIAQDSRPLRTVTRQPAMEVPAVVATVPAPASNPPLSVAVESTAVAKPGIPTKAPLFAPVLNAWPVFTAPNAVVRPMVAPAVLPAEETAGPTGDGAEAAPRLLRPETALAGTDLAAALAASRNAIAPPVALEPGSAPTEESGARNNLGNRRASAFVPRQTPTAGVSSGPPMDLNARPAYFAPAPVAVPVGLPADSSPARAPAVSIGAELPATASVAAFSSQLPAASRQPVSALPGVSPDVLPSAEDTDPVAPGVDFLPPAAIRIRPTAAAVVPRSASAGIAILDDTMQPAVAANVRMLPRNEVSPISLVTSAATSSREFPLPGATVVPTASGQGADIKPESSPAFSPALPAGDTATPTLPGKSLSEKSSLPASMAADADTSATAQMPAPGAVPVKFAEQFAADRAEPKTLAERDSVKNTINVVGQLEEMPTAYAGINAAKKSGTMHSDQPQTSSDAPTLKSSAQAADAAVRFDGATITASKPESKHTEWVQPAGRTLAIVRDVAERMQTTANRVVEFDVNSQPGARLSVRLEYRGGVVHTTFRTDSIELRDTLTREWQSTMPSVVAGERSVRLAEPTFTAAPAPRGENQSLDLGGQTTRQQQQDTPQPQEKAAFSSDFAFARGASARRTAEPVPVADTFATPTLSPDTAKHLHAFA